MKYREDHDRNCTWLSHMPTPEEPYFGSCSCGYDEWRSKAINLVKMAGCTCNIPLLGWIPSIGPRCRMCNIIVNLKDIDNKDII